MAKLTTITPNPQNPKKPHKQATIPLHPAAQACVQAYLYRVTQVDTLTAAARQARAQADAAVQAANSLPTGKTAADVARKRQATDHSAKLAKTAKRLEKALEDAENALLTHAAVDPITAEARSAVQGVLARIAAANTAAERHGNDDSIRAATGDKGANYAAKIRKAAAEVADLDIAGGYGMDLVQAAAEALLRVPPITARQAHSAAGRAAYARARNLAACAAVNRAIRADSAQSAREPLPGVDLTAWTTPADNARRRAAEETRMRAIVEAVKRGLPPEERDTADVMLAIVLDGESVSGAAVAARLGLTERGGRKRIQRLRLKCKTLPIPVISD